MPHRQSPSGQTNSPVERGQQEQLSFAWLRCSPLDRNALRPFLSVDLVVTLTFPPSVQSCSHSHMRAGSLPVPPGACAGILT